MFTQSQTHKIRIRVACIVALLIQTSLPLAIGSALAVTPTFTYVQVNPDRNAPNVATTGTICASYSATNASAGTETTVRVTFPAGFTVSTTAANWAVNSTSATDWPTGSVAWPGIAVPTNAPVGQVVDFVSTDIASSGVYCFNWTNSAALTTKATSGNSLTGIFTVRSGVYPGTADLISSNYAESVIGASTTADQVTITATVPPTFIFALSGNAQAFTGNLDPSSTVSTAPLTATVTTNAASGYVVFVKDLKFKTVTDSGSSPANQHGALQSATAGNYSISNNTSNSLGLGSHLASTTQGSAEDYGFAVTTVAQGGGGQGGTAAANAAYTSVGTTSMGTLDPTGYRPFGSSGGTSNGDVYTFLERANILGITSAATDYTDTLTIVASGKF